MTYRLIIITTICLLNNISIAQIYFTKEGSISFYSQTPIEEIKANNDKAVSVIDFNKSTVEFSVLIKGFHFKNALMQTHFNENYMESNSYPKAVFKSSNANLEAVNTSKNGTYTIPITGVLTIREKDKEIVLDGTFTVHDGKISAKAEFIVTPEDFNISIPDLVREKIAKEIEVSVTANYQIYEKS